jgi:hypothetical protein
MRKLGYLVVALLGVGSTAIGVTGSSAAQARSGSATGRAVACAGPATTTVAHLSVYRGSTLIRRSTITGGTTFHFVLPPGTYFISNEGHPGRYVGSNPFRVRAGRTTHVEMKDYCR